ncbi:MAG: 4Fe-4S binding protein [Rhodobacteraceae bacterium]|nr:4Fe-4S binding protein [Paracoccaceae bacterium]
MLRRCPVAVTALASFGLFAPYASAQDGAPQALSLDDLDALESQDSTSLLDLTAAQVVELIPLLLFFTLAFVSFFKKNTYLKYATLVYAVVYMGLMKANLVSLVHVFRILDGSFPILKYSMPWYLLMAVAIISTFLWGRFYCGRICAFGALTQLMDRVLPKRLRVEIPARYDRKAAALKYVILTGAVGYFLLTNDPYIYKYIEPFWMFTLSGSTVMWIMLAALLLLTVFVRNFYCRYLCSVGALLGLMSFASVFRIKRWSLCNSCKLCERACEWGAIKGPKISVTECVRCDDCEILYNDKERCAHWLLATRAERRIKPIPAVPPSTPIC